MKSFLVILISLLHIFTYSIPGFSQKQLTQKTLESDLEYYYKKCKEQNLSLNDRLYILNRIYNKYKNTNINLTKLNKEIEKVKAEKERLQKSKTKSLPEQKIQQQKVQQPDISSVTPPEEEKYTLSPGDVMYIMVRPAEELSREVTISPDGMIAFPLIGTVKAAGLTVKEFSSLLEKNLSVYISRPKVNITMKYLCKQQVFIMGEVKRPGGYQYTQGMRLLELITTAGGVTNVAGTKNIKIYRGEENNQQTFIVNLDEIIKFADTTKDFVLHPGDIVEVPKQPKTVSVIGAVNNPGEFEWYEGMDLLKALSLAKGPTETASVSSVKIFRTTSEERKVINVHIGRLLDGDLKNNFPLEPGDTVSVPRKPLLGGQWFVNTVLPWLTLLTMIIVIADRVR